ncbi:lecithin-cholesterol acyltransferase-like 4 [Iris pallida]|nr:lecithin-cholesterol acyltransferase-like 4 [Iris pallida]
MQQLLIECPSIYELMASPIFSWENNPLLQIWRGKHDDSSKLSTLLESYNLTEMLPLMKEALSSNMVEVDGKKIHLPLNLEILKWANKTREILSRAMVPATVKFYNIYGTHNDTPHSVCYGTERTPIADLKQLLSAQPKYLYVNGDGTVPVESAKADGLEAVARVGVAANHRGIICDHHVFRILKHWLKAGEPDPFYNPLNDYVILPTASEVEKHWEKGMQVTTLKEEWDVLSPDTDANDDDSTDNLAMVGTVSVASVGKEQPLVSAQATILVHQHIEGMKHVEVRASRITMGT